jgi:hypothetical protein
MSDAQNINGTAYALTVFCAILPGREEEVRQVIEGLPRGSGSPMARLPVHTSRLQIIDHLVYQGAPQKPDTLRNKYLVFTAAFDAVPFGGKVDGFLDLLVDRVGDEADRWWRHCVAYPGMVDRGAFKRWIKHNQIHTGLLEVATPNQTVESAREALAIRERVLAFAISAQGRSPREVQESFSRAFADIT